VCFWIILDGVDTIKRGYRQGGGGYKGRGSGRFYIQKKKLFIQTKNKNKNTDKKLIKIRIEPKQKGTYPNGQIPNCLPYSPIQVSFPCF
jgi:hypothetical protein